MASAGHLNPRVILRNVMESTFHDYSKCAHCYSDLKESESRHSFQDTISVFRQKISIVDALDELVDLKKKLHLTTTLFEECRLALCEQCFNTLTTVYTLLANFLTSAKDPSFLYSILKFNKTVKRVTEIAYDSSVDRESDDGTKESGLRCADDFWPGDEYGAAPLTPEQILAEDDGIITVEGCQSSFPLLKKFESQNDSYDQLLVKDENQETNTVVSTDAEWKAGGNRSSCDGHGGGKSESEANSRVTVKRECSSQKTRQKVKARARRNVKRYKCDVCSEAFSRSYHLQRHFKVHSEVTCSCAVCGAGFRTQLRLESHVRIHQGGLDSDNAEVANNESGAEASVAPRGPNVHDGDVDFSGATSGSDSESQSSSKKVLPMRKSRRILIISSSDDDEDRNESSTETNVKEKKPKYDRNAKRYKCEVCSEKFSRTWHLRRHMKCHVDSRFICHVCQAGFRNELRLQEHIRKHDPNYVREKAPNSSEPKEKRPANPDRELFAHHPGGLVECLICGKTMPDRHNIYSHIASHRGEAEKMMICELCGKTFKTMTSLKHHMLCHEDTREFLCNECGMAFKRRHHLREHIDVRHLNKERCYVCPEPNCGKAFARKRNLRKHASLHIGTKFPCEYGCGALFSCKFNRRVHQETSCKNIPADAPRREKRVRKSRQSETVGNTLPPAVSNAETSSTNEEVNSFILQPTNIQSAAFPWPSALLSAYKDD